MSLKQASRQACVETLKLASEALSDVYELARNNPSDRASLGIREIILKAMAEMDLCLGEDLEDINPEDYED